MRALHLSDPHIPRASGPDHDGVDPRAVLTQLLHDCRHVADIDVVVVSGDVADDGSVEGYIDALALIGDFARDHGAAQVWSTGNHDDRKNFTEILGTGHFDVSGRDIGRLAPSASNERAAVSNVAGVRIVTLDSLVPGRVEGRLSKLQMDWLKNELATPSPTGTVVVLHHPPISVTKPWAQASLQDPSQLADVIRGSDVLAVLCGHVHAQVTGFLAGVPVWVGPGVVTRIDLSAPPAFVRAVRGSAATVADFTSPGAPQFHVLHARDPRAGEVVYVADSQTWQYVPSSQEAQA